METHAASVFSSSATAWSFQLSLALAVEGELNTCAGSGSIIGNTGSPATSKSIAQDSILLGKLYCIWVHRLDFLGYVLSGHVS